MCAGHAGGQNGGGSRLNGHDLDLRLLALQVFANAGDGAAGANACHEDIHCAIGIGEDFGAGGLKMGFGVCGVGELAGNEAVGDLLCQLLSLGDSALHALCALGEHQLRAIGLHQLAALNGHGLGHDDDDAVASCGSHGGKADTGVAGGRLDNGGAGFQLAGALRVVNHGLCDTVLHGAGGVEVL